MVNITVNGAAVQVPEGTTILNAAKAAGVDIPHLCYLKDLNEIGACRVCCVEIEGERNLVPSCNNPVFEGMAIRTNTDRGAPYPPHQCGTDPEPARLPLRHLPAQRQLPFTECGQRSGHSGEPLPLRSGDRCPGPMAPGFSPLPRHQQVHQMHALHPGLRQSAGRPCVGPVRHQ